MKTLCAGAIVASALLASGCASYSLGLSKAESQSLSPEQKAEYGQNRRAAEQVTRPAERFSSKFSPAHVGTNEAPQPKEDERNRLAQLFSDKAEYVALISKSDSDTTLPRLWTSLHPKYPFGLGFSDTKAVVKIAVVISESGSVEEARVYETSDARFSYEALEAVKDWTFHPGARKGVVAKFVLIVPILFDGRQK